MHGCLDQNRDRSDHADPFVHLSSTVFWHCGTLVLHGRAAYPLYLTLFLSLFFFRSQSLDACRGIDGKPSELRNVIDTRRRLPKRSLPIVPKKEEFVKTKILD